MRPDAILPADRPLRVVLWGTYDTGKPRVRILREGLRRNGAEVMELHHPLWEGIEDKSQIRSPKRWLKIATSMLMAYPRLIWGYLRVQPHDIVLVAYPGLLDLFVLRLLAWGRGVPLAWDWFLSAYDTIIRDRKLLSARNPVAWLIQALEWAALRLADVTFMDTEAHARRMELMFGLAKGRIGRVWVGAEEEAFVGEAVPEPPEEKVFTVLFYGQFIPLHGIETVIDAAASLREEEIDWWIIGTGQEAARIDAIIVGLALPRVRRIQWLPYEQLHATLVRADVVLGIFGSSDKAASVIPNKVYQAVMARRPLITRDSPALRELLRHAPPFVQLIPADNPDALAAAVLRAKGELTAEASTQEVALAPFDTFAIGRQLVALLRASSSSSTIRK